MIIYGQGAGTSSTVGSWWSVVVHGHMRFQAAGSTCVQPGTRFLLASVQVCSWVCVQLGVAMGCCSTYSYGVGS